jgi:hypothetical protein
MFSSAVVDTRNHNLPHEKNPILLLDLKPVEILLVELKFHDVVPEFWR